MKNILNQLSLFASLSLLIACGGTETNDGLNKEDIIPVKLIPLQQGENTNTIQASGVFTTEDEAVLSFKNGGIVQQITVNEGDHVNKGQLLAKLNMTEINTGVQQTDLALEKAERDYRRAQQLFTDSVATKEQLENAKTARDIAIQQNRAAQFNQNFSEIRASTNGYILKRFVNEGQTVGPGTPILQVNGAGNTDWKLKVGVSDQQWALLNIGDEALIESNLSIEKINGQVLRKSEGIDPSSGTFSVTLKINPGQNLNLASGAFARAIIYPSNKTTGWKIPYNALLDGNANQGFVFVTDDKKTAKKVKVTLGAISKDGVMVLSGLENYGYLIISGSAYLSDGSKINALSNQDSLKN
ncbi:efflux RND transporter periplasmic adaptor subunit [Albibacterium bauzanense]|uniref:RND family efflux transporter MFP subunit n=1 Tax=Albibacterium bauzanense TaxID=653929 RepID=A0A4R1M1B2_9SPHI|nr:efflux RND transporter periplasmic adaptor subunit [Albibacterium bauzanense]TCK84760.1 RND family efflux transporter MFP subunit [Albibacterium bauzanense]